MANANLRKRLGKRASYRKDRVRDEPPTPKRAVLRAIGLPANQAGRESEGLFPEISRTRLAALLGVHVSTVTHWFSGRNRPGLDMAFRIADAIGVTVRELNEQLAASQTQWQFKLKRGERK